MYKVNILKSYVNKQNLGETLEIFTDTIETNDKIRVTVTPVNCLLWAKRNPKLEHIYNSADISTADGVPLIWASKLLGDPIRGRVTGLDLLPEFSKIAAENGYSFFLLGAAEGVADRLKDKLEVENPGLNVVGTYSPPYAKTFSEEENQKMINMINEVKPNVLWVSLTAPKQDYWIHEHFDKLDVNIAIGVGAAFDVVVGDIERSPEWMQKYGLEWFYRLIKEPKRLYKRYLIEAPRFIPLVLIQAFKERVLRRKSD
ncbi:glycosyltransferase [Rhodohalobacter sp. SW132]|uniref:WecB/TagA/CpsF family glycosyltransferase n=1 Tax=Rhodohalobacter sp. SW132 TaxID=2293433 RepID=UPI000E234172|nr:WecB/TagA/CpsF family glycosyltransferase [Rhodohalobacter sp. SW132]REL37537.1 glycosyltransferase [Rhodohalobacter sp. SW132]